MSTADQAGDVGARRTVAEGPLSGTPAGRPANPQASDQPVSNQPVSDQPVSDQPGGDQPGGDQLRVTPLPGDGVVLRRPGLVAVVGAGSPSAVQAVLDLLALADQPSGALSRTLVGHLAGASPPAPPLGVVLHGDGGHLLLHGPVVATVTSLLGEQRHDGRDAALCVDTPLPHPFTAVTMVLAGATPGAPPAWAHLADGLVPGAGVAVAHAGAQAGDTHAGAQAGEAHAGAQAGDTHAGAHSGGMAGAAQEPAPVLVDGVECALGHFNHPFALRCATCESSLVAATRHTVKGRRPPLGSIAFDDGARYVLDADYVVGREPETDPAVAAGEARPLPLDDPEQLVSRVHAEIRLQDWDVVLVDRGSANGVHVLPPEGTEWRRLDDGQSTVLSAGTQVSFGRRVMTYEASA